MPLGSLPFHGKSIYCNSYNPHDKVKVNLPIIQRDSFIKTKGISQFETTSKKSFELHSNPEL